MAANIWELNERLRGACGDLSKQAYDPGSDWHTSHLEVRGNSIGLLINGGVVVENVNNTLIATDGGGVDLLAQTDVQLNVRSLTVISLMR